MRSVVFTESGELVLRDRPMPTPGEQDVLVKVHACGVCGTDIHIARGEHAANRNIILGHEFAGEVVEVGAGVAGIGVGDKVTVDPNIVDGTCFFCRRGEIHLCENLSAVGVNMDGGFAEYCRVPAAQVYKVPDDMDMDSAALAEPLACCVHGLDRVSVTLGSSVLILGAGSIGLIFVQLMRASGAGHVIVSEPDERKRGLAAQLGSDIQIDPLTQNLCFEVSEITGVGPDIVVESAGRVDTAEAALQLARRGGQVLQFGVVPEGKQASVVPHDIFSKELTIRGSFINPFTHSRAVELLASGQVDVKPLITHRFPLEDARKAFETASGGDAIKVLLTP